MAREMDDQPVAVITGGGTGIGMAIAEGLTSGGHHCVLVGRRPEVLDDAVADLGTGSGLTADITRPADRERVVETVMSEHGRMDVLVHSAGIFEKRDVAATDAAFFAHMIELNLNSVMGLTRAAWSALSESSGQVVLVSSIAAGQAFPGNAAYAASKGGLTSLGEVLRLEGKPAGIRIITVAPGQTATPIWTDKAPEAVLERMMDPSAVGRFVASLVALDRGIDIEPVVIRPFQDPWTATDTDDQP